MGDVQGRNNVLNKSLKYTVTEFNRKFPDDDACLEYIKEQRFPDGIATCEKCKAERKHYRVSGRTAYACDHCGSHIYPLVGTIFEKSTTSLRLWFHAMFQMGSTKCEISAKQIQRETGVTYKTAWRMFRQIRTLIGEEISPEGSTVEIDKMYHGGKCKGRSGRPGVGDKRKMPVVGMIERGGRVVVRATEDIQSATLLGLVREYVLPTSTIYIDKLRSHGGIKGLRDRNNSKRSAGYQHHRINHSSKVLCSRRRSRQHH